MKAWILGLAMVIGMASPALAGGILCKQCPAENDKCIPRACPGDDLACPDNSASECLGHTIGDHCSTGEPMKIGGACVVAPATAGSFCFCSTQAVQRTAGGACCSWGDIPNCFKGC